jgi:hypothetical protein
MALLGRRGDILAQPLVDYRVVRAEDRGATHRGLARRRLRVAQRLAYQVTAHPIPLRQRSDRQALALGVFTNPQEELFFP